MSIERKIKEIIKLHGFITVDKFMELAMSEHVLSYYRKPDILGASGDFITAPEVSQLFGEIIALWCTQQWEQLGKPKKIGLFELGPGKGLLMRDLLRVAKLIPEFYDALEIHLLDINPHLIKEQKSILAGFNRNIVWRADFADLTPLPTIFIANEFFDALPIKQYIKRQNIWNEITVIYDEALEKLQFSTISISQKQNTKISAKHVNAKEEAIVEESVVAQNIMQFICNHMKNFGGSGLIIDYGYNIPPEKRNDKQYNSTLQAIKKHTYHKLLEEPGKADWSSHVDFYNLRQVIPIPIRSRYKSQAEFLLEYGIALRADILKNQLKKEQQYIIDKQLNRLTADNQMGQLFKVLELAP